MSTNEIIRKFFEKDPGLAQKLVDKLDESDQRRVSDLVLGEPEDEDRLKVTWYQDIAENPVQVPWSVKGLYKRGSLNVNYAGGGDLKTWSGLTLGLCQATGNPFLGYEIPEPQRVLYIDEEIGPTAMEARIMAVSKGLLLDRSPIPFAYISNRGFRFSDPEDLQYLDNMLTGERIDFAHIDNLRATMVGDENSARDMYPYLHGLKRLAIGLDISLNIYHHANKLGGYSGHNALFSESDVVTRLYKGPNILTFSVEKDRWGSLRKYSSEYTFVEDHNKDTIQFYLIERDTPTTRDRLSPSEEFALEFFTTQGEASMNDVKTHAEFTGLFRAGTMQNAIRKLVQKNKLENTNPNDKGGRGKAALFRVNEDETDESSKKE